MCVVDRLTSQYWNSHLFVVCVRLKGYTCLDRLSAFLRSRNLVLLGPSAASWTQSCLSRTPGPGPKKALSLSSSASRLSHFELTRSQSLACSCDTDEDYYQSNSGFFNTRYFRCVFRQQFCQTCKWFVFIFSKMTWPLCRCDSTQVRNSCKDGRIGGKWKERVAQSLFQLILWTHNTLCSQRLYIHNGIVVSSCNYNAFIKSHLLQITFTGQNKLVATALQ